MATNQQVIVNIKDRVDKLINVGQVEGNLVNNGTIYLVATFDLFRDQVQTQISSEEFVKMASEYIEKLKRFHSFTTLIGVDPKANLFDYYVFPQLVTVGETTDVTLNSIEEFRSILSLEEIYIFGKPGSGKSTLLRYIIQSALTAEFEAIPVYLSLASFRNRMIVHKNYTIYDHIEQEFAEFGFPKPFLEFMVKSAPILLLLDGFDEAYQDDAEKALVIEQVRAYKKIHNDSFSKIIITSRTRDYNFADARRRNLELLPLNSDQLNEFLLKRLGYEEKRVDFLNKISRFQDATFETRNLTDTPAKDWAEDRSILLANKGMVDYRVAGVLLKNKADSSLITNPLLLSLFCNQYSQAITFSTERYKLIDDTVNYIIKKIWLTRIYRIFLTTSPKQN